MQRCGANSVGQGIVDSLRGAVDGGSCLLGRFQNISGSISFFSFVGAIVGLAGLVAKRKSTKKMKKHDCN